MYHILRGNRCFINPRRLERVGFFCPSSPSEFLKLWPFLVEMALSKMMCMSLAERGGAFGRRPISSGSPRSAAACSAGQLVVFLSITTLLLCSNYLLRFSHQRFRRFGCTRVKLITVKYHNYAKTNEVSALSSIFV